MRCTITKSIDTFVREVNVTHFSTAAERSTEKLLQSNDPEKKIDKRFKGIF